MHAVFMIDLNGFKKINDVYGHPEGDDVLVAVAERLRIATRDRDLVARPGGDEFAVLAKHLAGSEGATNVAARILKEFESPISTGSHNHRVGAGIGIALIPRDGCTSEEVLRKADIALYRAKKEAVSAIKFFDEEMDRQVQERDAMERELARAIGSDSLRPWYQPIVDLKTGEIVEFEALARWSHPLFGEVPPERFIPVAESAGLIRELGDWLLRCAAMDAVNWPDRISLSFNISPVQLKDKTLGLRILKILEESGLRPQRLEIEITESAIVQDLENAQHTLGRLRDAGIRIALDDFGTGYSSLYHLRSFKIDKIKIDRSFIHAMGSEAESAAIVKALTGLGNGLGLMVTGEGIEGQDERETLLLEGCQQGQGFLFSKAVRAVDTAAFFEKEKKIAARA
jgi:diguanylate cyclase (GGDEF)-like protein